MKRTWLIGASVAFLASTNVGAEPPKAEEALFRVKSVDLPISSLVDEVSARVQQQAADEKPSLSAKPGCGSSGATNEQRAALRQCQYQAYIALQKAKYDVEITDQRIGGIATEVFVPKGGVSPTNRTRVLINLHGGGFVAGARTISKIEAIPIAGTGRIKVISVDYRQGPENVFPAASEDVAIVYRELLKTYKPKQIGIYGCSAGGLLTAQSVARILKEDLPLPGAIGMFCTGANYWSDGDSGYLLGQHLVGGPIATVATNPYFKGIRADDEQAFPALSPRLMSQFPPSLLVSGTRDFGLSSVVNTHARLIGEGVTAELHVWEGLEHAFLFDPRLPESQETYRIVADFFDRRLAP